ncbi:MAG TPA: hypothetical protein PKM44_00095 [Turneriella sp.]|nr:hypothetical protein [Turneriella sp.]HMY11072.1 hypothetical protein [Turneriella sp.]HNA79484.1 hypothetical protein [Turneriella sp.]HNE18262.1 hypothetical protein [Turneriella sp.]HNJ66072.1 hypothetical protein [Turneriella sp.]
MVIKLIVMFALFCALLYLLNKAMPDFHIEMGAIPVVALILVGVNVVVGALLGGTATVLNVLTLGIIKWILQFITLGLFGLLVSFVFNVIIFWVADKLTDRLTIKTMRTLLVSAGALQFTNFLLNRVF